MSELIILFLRGFYLSKFEQLRCLLSNVAVTNSDDFRDELLSAARDGVLESWCKQKGFELSGLNLQNPDKSLYEEIVKRVTGQKDFKAAEKAFIGNFAEPLTPDDFKYDDEKNTLKVTIRPIKPTNDKFDFVVKESNGMFIANSGTVDWKDKTKNTPVPLTFNLKKHSVEEAVLWVNGVEKVSVIETCRPVQSYTANGVVFNMILVKHGDFMRGTEPNKHKVTLTKDYYIGETQVTQELWQAVMGYNPSKYYGSGSPVDSVSWGDCKEFINKLNSITGKNFRLPSEAEWEFAARGGVKSKGFAYAGGNKIEDVAWYSSNSHGRPQRVAQKTPNELHIFDMSGNVSEWCEDWYGSYENKSQFDPIGPSSSSCRVLRGGGCDFDAVYCRVSSRDGCNPVRRNGLRGLRLALSS